MTSLRVAYETARLRLSRYRHEGREGRLRAAMHATQVSADTLRLDRVGVWEFSERKDSLACLIQYDRASGQHGRGTAHDVSRCPAYLTRLSARRVLAVEDVSTHPATCELGPLHLTPMGVTAVLDAPILRGGRVVGVVRHESQNGPRAWTQQDVDFASSVADMVTLIFEQSERLELEAALQEQTEQRLEAQKMEALGRLASAIAHDFNNVLNTIGIATELAALKKSDVSSLALGLSDVIDTGRRLTEQLLTFAVKRADTPEASCDLGAVIESMLPMLRTATGGGVVVSVQVVATHGTVGIGRSQAEQVLLNLVLNSRDAIANTGAVHIILRDAVPQDESPPGSVVLSVSDDGVGMDETTRSRVFEPYFTTKAHGSGLGLATVFGIVRGAGGATRVESEPGKGTTVQLVFPRHEST